jgi:hypothetical protein
LFLQTQAVMARLNLVLLPQHDLLVHTCIFHNFVFRRAWEYFRTTRVLDHYLSHPHPLTP